jgi:outer membrane protein assembly factor BamD
MRKIVGLLTLLLLINACSQKVDTSTLSPEEYFNYVKGLYDDGDFRAAIPEFQSILLQYPGSTVNDDAQYYLAMSYFNEGQYILGAYEFSKLIKDIPASPYVSDSQYMLADCYYELSPDYRLDQSYTKKAIQEFQSFLDYFPTSPKVKEVEAKIDELHNKLAHKQFRIAELYYRMEYYNAAVIYYTAVMNEFYDTEYASKALVGRIETELQMNKKSAALSDIEKFFTDYPDREDEAQKVTEIKNKYFPNKKNSENG